ncbi:uncharacterized protein [Spinacia oleracea]|uniref:Late embryogenesis abundant protein LEA-2 subgroup domain-containing protein n=1 Tax=Spinacia oleracea TaxID=3562 RepID=A0ABM3QJ66_SPIOL|nr:uncharacterized protein LOC130459835 [Spinacia oleracea]
MVVPRWLFLFMSFVHLIIGIGLLSLIISLSMVPNSPKFKVQSVNTITPLVTQQISNTTINTFSGSFNIALWIGKPNNGILKQQANVSVYYRNQLLVSSPSIIKSFCPDHPTCNNVRYTLVPLTIKVSLAPIFDNSNALSMASEIDSGKVTLIVKVNTKDYRTRSWWVGKDTTELNVTCNNVKLGASNGVVLGNSKPCDVYWYIDDYKKSSYM